MRTFFVRTTLGHGLLLGLVLWLVLFTLCYIFHSKQKAAIKKCLYSVILWWAVVSILLTTCSQSQDARLARGVVATIGMYVADTCLKQYLKMLLKQM